MRKLIYALLVLVVICGCLQIALTCRARPLYDTCIRIKVKPESIIMGKTYIYHATIRNDGKNDLNLYQTEYNEEQMHVSIYGDITVSISTSFPKRLIKSGEEVEVEVRIKFVRDRNTALTTHRPNGYPVDGIGSVEIAEKTELSVFYDYKLHDAQ